MEDILGIFIRISILYLFLLLMLRLTGKRGLDTLSPFDFLVGLILGDTVDDAIWNEIPFANGLTAVTVILSVHVGLALISSRSSRINVLINSQPTVVVKDGKFVYKGLAKERTRPEEVLSELRREGEESLEDILDAQWESGGQLSYRKRSKYRLLRKKELKHLKEQNR
jgi:uncharacterized membrane protein YcaP (DUF421 family)